MAVNDEILAAVRPTVPHVYPDIYTGDEDTYCTFVITEHPAEFRDNEPAEVLYDVQVHLFAPHGLNTMGLRRGIRDGLISTGFTHPTILSMSDSEGQHYVFECEFLEGYDG